MHKSYMLQVKFDFRLNFFNLGWFSIGHLHHLLLRPESLRAFISCANYGFCQLNLAGITKFKYEKKNDKDSDDS